MPIWKCCRRIRCGADWRSKTRRNRFIAFTAETIERLRRWKIRRVRHACVFHEDGAHSRRVYDRITTKFDTAVTAAGIPRRTLQDLRRTVGTLLAERGVNQKVAAEVLGHSDPRTTARYYQAVRPEAIKAAILSLRPTGTDADREKK